MKKLILLKPTYLFWMGLVVVLPLLGACQKDEDTNSQPIDFRSLEYLNSCDLNIVDGENSDTYLVINSQEELSQHIIVNEGDDSSCINLRSELNVDFSKWTILIGKKRLAHIEGELIEQSVHIQSNDLVYKVNIKNGGYTAIGQFRFGVIVPKLAEGVNVKFDVVVE